MNLITKFLYKNNFFNKYSFKNKNFVILNINKYNQVSFIFDFILFSERFKKIGKFYSFFELFFYILFL